MGHINRKQGENLKFLATRHGKDGDYSETFEADSIADAYEYCRKKMWRLDGEVVASFSIPSFRLSDEQIAIITSGFGFVARFFNRILDFLSRY